MNTPPEAVVSAPSLNSFKNRLDSVWASHKYSQDSSWFANPTRARNVKVDMSDEPNEDEGEEDEDDQPTERPIA